MLAHFYDRCESAGATSLVQRRARRSRRTRSSASRSACPTAQEQQLKKAAPSLLKVAVDENAAECALALLNYVDEARRRSLVGDTSRRPPEVKEEDWRERNVPQGRARPSSRGSLARRSTAGTRAWRACCCSSRTGCSGVNI